MKFIKSFFNFLPVVLLLWTFHSEAQNLRVDGYRGLWSDVGQFAGSGNMYPGGLGSVAVYHKPDAIYSAEVKKTFFVYGGTTRPEENHLLIMISYYDHRTHLVPRPVIVYDKQGVDDPHDNASILIDGSGYIWVFVSGRARTRPGIIFKSIYPYNIDNFEMIVQGEMTFPQPWWIKGKGFLNMFSKATKTGNELFWKTSADGIKWSPDNKLAGMGGHYQVTNIYGNKLVSVFNYHPAGVDNKRTNIYIVQTNDFGQTWETIDHKRLSIPLTEKSNDALIRNFEAENKLVFLKDLNFDYDGNPVILAIISSNPNHGKEAGPHEWFIIHWKNNNWDFHKVCESTNNYDKGAIFIENNRWKIIGPTEPGPQKFATGGEIAMWISHDEGNNWEKIRDLTKHSDFNHSSLKRPMNANKNFYSFWFDGDPDKLSESHLYFSNMKGNKIWQLPYNMTSDMMKPLRIKK